jgi:hypothetical protein
VYVSRAPQTHLYVSSYVNRFPVVWCSWLFVFTRQVSGAVVRLALEYKQIKVGDRHVCAFAAIEEMGISRHKCTMINHILLCPRLMTQYWLRRLHLITDIVLETPAGACPFWPSNMHEPLLPSPLGNAGTPQAFWLWSGNCTKCGTTRTKMNGLFCANFATGQNGWKACHSVWCGPCYDQHPWDCFPSFIPAD